jgi:hypothetical protein
MSVKMVGSFTDAGLFDATRRKQFARSTVDDSLEKVQELVKANITPFSKSGELWKSVKKTGVKRSGAATWSGEVYSELEYTAAVEYGWAPREIEPERRKALQWAGPNGIAFSKGHWVGGFQGHHMFKKAETEFERLYANRIVSRNARLWLGTLDAGRSTVVF